MQGRVAASTARARAPQHNELSPALCVEYFGRSARTHCERDLLNGGYSGFDEVQDGWAAQEGERVMLAMYYLRCSCSPNERVLRRPPACATCLLFVCAIEDFRLRSQRDGCVVQEASAPWGHYRLDDDLCMPSSRSIAEIVLQMYLNGQRWRWIGDGERDDAS